jgi:hypothetical protein
MQIGEYFDTQKPIKWHSDHCDEIFIKHGRPGNGMRVSLVLFSALDRYLKRGNPCGTRGNRSGAQHPIGPRRANRKREKMSRSVLSSSKNKMKIIIITSSSSNNSCCNLMTLILEIKRFFQFLSKRKAVDFVIYVRIIEDDRHQGSHHQPTLSSLAVDVMNGALL